MGLFVFVGHYFAEFLETLQPKEEKNMRRKSNRLVLILSGIIVTVLIATSLIIVLFFPRTAPVQGRRSERGNN